MRLVFISSIAVVGQYPVISGPGMIPEVSIKDSRCTNTFGYGQAKLICEKMVEQAGRVLKST